VDFVSLDQGLFDKDLVSLNMLRVLDGALQTFTLLELLHQFLNPEISTGLRRIDVDVIDVILTEDPLFFSASSWHVQAQVLLVESGCSILILIKSIKLAIMVQNVEQRQPGDLRKLLLRYGVDSLEAGHRFHHVLCFLSVLINLRFELVASSAHASSRHYLLGLLINGWELLLGLHKLVIITNRERLQTSTDGRGAIFLQRDDPCGFA